MSRTHIISIIAFIGLVAALFALNPRNSQKVQAGVLNVLTPFFKAGSSVTTFRDGLKTLEQLEKQNTELLTQNKELKAISQTLRDLEAENQKLRAALEYRQRAAFKLVPARIVTRDSATWWNTVTIDKGTADGVDIDMPAMTDEGLVGKVTTVGEHIAVVVLIADENCKVAANVVGTREQGIVKGDRITSNTMPQLGMGFLSRDAKLTRGQQVVTSGVGGVYPAGIPIGVVDRFEARPLEGFAVVLPAVNLSELQDVFVVVGRK